MSRTRRTVVTTEPTSTTNITGLRIMVRGLSLMKHPARRDARSSTSHSAALLLNSLLISERLSAPISRCSSTGPRLSAGKKVRAPTMMMTATSRMLNVGVVTGNVPGEGGTIFFRARFPAMASIGTITRNRPTKVAIPMVVLYQSVLALSPGEGRTVIAGCGGEGVKQSPTIRAVLSCSGWMFRSPAKQQRSP